MHTVEHDAVTHARAPDRLTTTIALSPCRPWCKSNLKWRKYWVGCCAMNVIFVSLLDTRAQPLHTLTPLGLRSGSLTKEVWVFGAAFLWHYRA